MTVSLSEAYSPEGVATCTRVTKLLDNPVFSSRASCKASVSDSTGFVGPGRSSSAEEIPPERDKPREDPGSREDESVDGHAFDKPRWVRTLSDTSLRIAGAPVDTLGSSKSGWARIPTTQESLNTVVSWTDFQANLHLRPHGSKSRCTMLIFKKFQVPQHPRIPEADVMYVASDIYR